MGHMNKSGLVDYLISVLRQAMPEFDEVIVPRSSSYSDRRAYLRGLMNVYKPERKLAPEFFQKEDELLTIERDEKEPIPVFSLLAVEPQIALWQGDITRLEADAIVNAGNPALLGCFVPGHNCIDNCIHSASGLELRLACYEIMKTKKNREEPTGGAEITSGFNLPAKYVIHTVGPCLNGRLTNEDTRLLALTYENCLRLADQKGLRSIVFPCISTGVYGFPKDEAAQIAVDTVRAFLNHSKIVVVFNPFLDEDYARYEAILG
jgi:O-acetyl-ADP-ribose deacetylase (regulator of RNase III)